MNLLIQCAENHHFKIKAIKMIRKNGFYDERDLNKNDTVYPKVSVFLAASSI